MADFTVHIRSFTNMPKQSAFIRSPAKRKMCKAGRRASKTTSAARMAVEKLLSGHRVLYGAPTADQIERFWSEVKRALQEPLDNRVLYKNETKHIIELPGTENRIRAKTCWNADTLRGDYCDVLLLDEFQLMNEDTWQLVGAPMLLDNNGDAIFFFTPPSLHSRSAMKAKDPRHATKLFNAHINDKKSKKWDGRWECFHFTSHDNPHLSKIALKEITKDMTRLAIRQEIYAEDTDQAEGALWTREDIENNRVLQAPALVRVVVGVDPSGSSSGNECGIVAAGIDRREHHYTLDDASKRGSPDEWARAAIALYWKVGADVMVAEKNFGGEMVEKVIRDTDKRVNVKSVTASRGKAVRAEPISAMCERGTDHHVGEFELLEDEMCQWAPGDKLSPNRLDAKVWADTELKGGAVDSDDAKELGHVEGYAPIGVMAPADIAGLGAGDRMMSERRDLSFIIKHDG
jgi:hypothetical protein